MCVEVRRDKSGKDISGGSHMAVSAGAAGGTSDLEFINCYLNSDSNLMDSVKCDCLLNVKTKIDMTKEILENYNTKIPHNSLKYIFYKVF